jgi:hypothetical protein
VSFQSLQDRLLEIARERIRSGVFTERKLARLCGLSQPHMHNVLKRVRAPSLASADRLMQALELRISDLLWQRGSEEDLGVQAVPMLRSRIGPGSQASFDQLRGYIPLAETLLEDLVNPLAARLAADLVLPKSLIAHDLVLLDQNPNLRAHPKPNGLWVVSESGDMRVRYLRFRGGRLFIGNEANVAEPHLWRGISLQGRNILDIVRARVCWVGREIKNIF